MAPIYWRSDLWTLRGLHHQGPLDTNLGRAYGEHGWGGHCRDHGTGPLVASFIILHPTTAHCGISAHGLIRDLFRAPGKIEKVCGKKTNTDPGIVLFVGRHVAWWKLALTNTFIGFQHQRIWFSGITGLSMEEEDQGPEIFFPEPHAI